MRCTLMRPALVAYGVLLLVSLGLTVWQGRFRAIFAFPGRDPFLAHLLLGVLLAAFILSLAGVLRRSFAWARALDREFAEVFSGIRVRDAVVLALASGFVEEYFFRALLQPALGLWLTSAAFGLLHYPLNRRMLPWPILAGLLGLLFGWTYARTGSLLAVAGAHGLVNFVELLIICRTRQA